MSGFNDEEYPFEFFDINVVTMTGEVIPLMVGRTDKVLEVKMALFAKLGLLPDQQLLMFGNRELGWKFMSCSHCQELCQQASWLLIGCMHKSEKPIRS